MDFPEDLEFCQILSQLIPHLPKSGDAIQTLEEELKRSSIINWGNIRLVLSELHEYYFQNLGIYHSSSNKNKYIKFLFRVLTVFDTHKCSDLSVIADVLELLYLIIKYDSTEEDKAVSMGIPISNNNGQRYISAFEKLLVTSYKDIPLILTSCNAVWYSNGISCLHWDWVKYFTSMGKVDILKAIMSFGATPIVPQDDWYEIYDVFGIMLKLFNLGDLTVDDYSRFESTTLQNLKSKFDERSRKRFCFINTVLHIFFRYNFHTDTEEYIQCAEIFVEATPEPLITSKEIKCSITKLCSGNNCYNENLLEKFLEKYETYFPQSREYSKPRSLKHLCRFQVRECLRNARTFPYGAEALPVPKKIQGYICFKDLLL